MRNRVAFQTVNLSRFCGFLACSCEVCCPRGANVVIPVSQDEENGNGSRFANDSVDHVSVTVGCHDVGPLLVDASSHVVGFGWTSAFWHLSIRLHVFFRG